MVLNSPCRTDTKLSSISIARDLPAVLSERKKTKKNSYLVNANRIIFATPVVFDVIVTFDVIELRFKQDAVGRIVVS